MRQPLPREALVELVRKIIEVEGTEAEIDGYIDAVDRAVPDPNWLNLIYYNDQELSAEQVVDQALAYKPIAL